MAWNRRAWASRAREENRTIAKAADVAEPTVWSSPAVQKITHDAKAKGVDPGAVVLRYRGGASLKEIAADLGTSWPVIHLLIFDLRLAGVSLPSKRRM